MYFLHEAVSARGLFLKWTILISVIMDAINGFVCDRLSVVGV